MESVGRGRGRGLLMSKSPRDKPPGFHDIDGKPAEQHGPTAGAGDAPQVVVIETGKAASQLSALVESLSIDCDDKSDMIPIIGAIRKSAVDADSLSANVRTLLEKCDDDWHFAKSVVHCAVACCNAGLKSSDGTLFRAVFLKTLQSLYQNKDKLKSESPTKQWLSCVALLSQSLVQLSLPDGSPMAVFVGPVFQLLELCLSPGATDEEQLCAATQLLDVGCILSKCSTDDRLPKLHRLVRERIACGSETKLKMLDVVEGFASDWRPAARLSEADSTS